MGHRKDQYTAGEITKDWLYQKYHVEKLSMVDIGRIIDRNPKTVLHWMRKHGVPTRPRGSDERQHFRAGDPRSYAGTKHTEGTREKIGKASRERGAVPYKRNGVHWLKTVPPEENPNWNGGSTPERQTFYRSREWKRAVKAVWKRDKGICQNCGAVQSDFDRGTQTFHIHHVVTFACEELRADTRNLVLLCPDCHHWVHSNGNASGLFLGSPLNAERDTLAPTLFDYLETVKAAAQPTNGNGRAGA